MLTKKQRTAAVEKRRSLEDLERDLGYRVRQTDRIFLTTAMLFLACVAWFTRPAEMVRVREGVAQAKLDMTLCNAELAVSPGKQYSDVPICLRALGRP